MEAQWLGAITSAAVIILGRSLTTVFACVDHWHFPMFAFCEIFGANFFHLHLFISRLEYGGMLVWVSAP